MSWDQFIEFTNETAVYKGAGEFDVDEATYLGLAITGEVHEYLQELKNKNSNREKVLLELGDIFYYLARADQMFMHFGFFSFDGLQADDSRYDTYMFELCGDISNATKKLMRDDPDTLRIISHLRERYAEIYQSACASAKWRGTTRDDVLYKVAEKLRDRLARGKIKGSGDER
jgi:hypothetical protein